MYQSACALSRLYESLDAIVFVSSRAKKVECSENSDCDCLRADPVMDALVVPELLQIFIADDNDELRSLLAMYLGEICGSVVECSCGLDAMQSVVERRYDLMILDIMLPGKSGLDILKYVRTFSDVPVIVVSGIEAYRYQSLKLGADVFLTKPLQMKKLVVTAKGLLKA